MKKIAIVRSSTVQVDSYYDDYRTIATSITDWQEVSDEDFDLLKRYCYKDNFNILEQPIDQSEFILKTVEDFKKLAKKEAQLKAEEEQRRETKKLLAESKKIERAKAQYEKLAKVFGNNDSAR